MFDRFFKKKPKPVTEPQLPQQLKIDPHPQHPDPQQQSQNPLSDVQQESQSPQVNSAQRIGSPMSPSSALKIEHQISNIELDQNQQNIKSLNQIDDNVSFIQDQDQDKEENRASLNQFQQSEIQIRPDSDDQSSNMDSARKQQSQNKKMEKASSKYIREVEEKIASQKRDEFIDQVKTACSFQNIHPFELLIQFESVNIDYTMSIYEFKLALELLNIEVSKDAHNIMLKYFKVQESVSIIAFCLAIGVDLGDLIIMAINHMINKYRMIPEIFFDEITGVDKLLNIDSISKMNNEWNWCLDGDKQAKVYNSLTDYGQNSMTLQIFLKRLTSVSQNFESKLYKSNYQQMMASIYYQNGADQLIQMLKQNDSLYNGQVSLSMFYEIMGVILERSLSKQEVMVVQVFLLVEEPENTISYLKFVDDLKQFCEDQKKIQFQRNQKKLQTVQESIVSFFKLFLDRKTPFFEQYFKGTTRYSITLEQFLDLSSQLSGFQITQVQANEMFQFIKYGRQNQTILTVFEFSQFMELHAQTLASSEIISDIVKSEKESQIKNSVSASPQKKIDKSKPITPFQGGRQSALLKKDNDEFKKDKSQKPEKSLLELLKEDPYKMEQDEIKEAIVPESKLKGASTVLREKTVKESSRKVIANLRADLVQLFNDVDKNKLLIIDQQQVFQALRKLGIITLSKDLNKQNKYNYQEFEKLVLQYLKVHYYRLDTNRNSLTLMDKLKIILTYDELTYLQQIFDSERTGKIRHPDLIYLLWKHPIEDFKTSQIIFKIKGYNDFPIGTIRNLFSKIPDHFSRPFSSQANLPSYSLKPKPNILGQYSFVKSDTMKLYKLKLKQAEGVPYPKEGVFRREVVVSVFDKFYQNFIENTLVIKATHNPDNPDIWLFKEKDRKNGFYINLEEIKYSEFIYIIFEFVIYIKEGNQSVKISCCFAEVPVNEVITAKRNPFALSQGVVKKVPLIGGYPHQKLNIKPFEIQRKGLFKFGPVQAPSELTFTYERRSQRTSLITEVEYLPKFCLIHRYMVQIYYAYLKILKKRYESNQLLNTNNVINFIFYCFDCPYICKKLCTFWSRTIKGKYIGKEEPCYHIVISLLYRVTKLKDYQYNSSFPNEIFIPEQSKNKRRVVNSIINYAEYCLDQSFMRQLNLDVDTIMSDQKLYASEVQPLPMFEYLDNDDDPYFSGFNYKIYEEFMKE